MTRKRKISHPSSSRGRKRIWGRGLSLAQSAKQLRSKCSACMKDKEVIWNSQHGFTRVRQCLNNLMAFCDQNIDSVDEGETSTVVSRCV